MPFLSKKGAREWKKYNTPGLPKPASAEDLTSEVKRKPGFGEGLVAGSAELVDLIATGLFAMPLAAAREQLTRGQRAIEQGLGFGRGKNMSRREIAEEAAADAARINETYGSPVLSTLRNWGVVGSDETPIEQGFSAAMARAGQLGENIEHLSKGQVLKEDVLSLVNLSFGALGVKGVEAVGKARMSRAKAQEAAKWLEAVNLDASLRETARMQQGDKPLQLGLGSNEPMISFPDGSVSTRAEAETYIRGLPESQQVAARAKLLGFKTEPGAPQPQPFAAPGYVETPTGRVVKPGERAESPAEARQRQLADEANARKKAREQARANARAAFAQEPGLDAETKSARGLDLNEADRMQRLAEGQVEQRQATLPPQAGDMRGGVSAAVQSGMQKLARGKPLSLTEAERAALRLETLPSNKKGFAADPKLLTAAAVGATGLGLAMTYEPDASEAAMAIGAGALMLGKGKGLTLDAIRTAADDTPLRTFRDASATTLNTLENLPGNRSRFTFREIEELLTRPEITEAERGILREVLETTRSPFKAEGAVSARAALGGTQPQRYDFGLDAVRGAIQDRPLPSREGLEDTITAKQLMAGVKQVTGDFELKPIASDQYADYGLKNIDRKVYNKFSDDPWIPDNATPAEEAALRAEHEQGRPTAPQATTTIYRSPIELGTNNHFGDPNYFAHTRSFEEGGVKHVVELQSDLAQKAGKVLTPEERATIQAQFTLAENVSKYLDEIATKDKPYGMEERNRARELADAADIPYVPGESLKILDNRVNLRLDELSAKLGAGENIAAISPMLKNWHKRLVREELASAARGAMNPEYVAAREELKNKIRYAKEWEGPHTSVLAALQEEIQADAAKLQAIPERLPPQPFVRFATADTVAKVEGWPEARLREVDQKVVDLRDELARIKELGYTAGEDWFDQVQSALTKAEKAQAEAPPPPRFSPEHQGIYDRYAGDVEKFLKQLGGKPYKDSAGHTWLEVPVEGTKRMPAGPRAQQFGFGQVELMATLAALGVGVYAGKWIEQYLSDNEDSKGRLGATLGFAAAGLAALAASKHGGLSDFARAAVSKLDYTLGALETRLGNMSQALLRRLTDFEFASMKRAHESGIAFAPFVKAWKAVKKGPEKEALRAALTTNEPGKILPALGRAGSPALVAAYKAAIAGQLEIGKELQKYGLLKDLRPEYFTRMVTDYAGLRKAMGKDDGDRLHALIDAAEKRSVKLTGAPLSPIEVSNITNKFLTSGEYRGIGKKAGFLRKRVIGEVTQQYLPFYAQPDEGLLLYARAASNAIEKARLFKDFEVKDPVTGKMDLEKSIGNLLMAEKAAGRVSPEQVQELHQMLLHRFGPGEHSMAGWLQDIRNTTNLFLLGNPYAGIAQVGDIYTNVAANRLLPTIYAAAQLVGQKPGRVTLRDMGIVNHIAEELTGTRATAKLLDKALKTGLSPVDTLGKSLFLNGKLRDFQQQSRTANGLRNLTDRYAEYFGPTDFPQLISDLRAGVRSPLVDSMLFRELSNVQPITKLAQSELALKHPNARILFMLRSFQLKQIDNLRREAYNEIRAGFKTGERHRVLRGANRLMRFGMALGVSGATTAAVMDFLYGKDVDVSIGDVLLNATKVFGLSQYTLAALERGERIEAVASMALPPWRVWDHIVSGDPKALRYLPLIGPYVYWHGTEAGQEAREREAARKAREEAKE
jgi:hypothetical protein